MTDCQNNYLLNRKLILLDWNYLNIYVLLIILKSYEKHDLISGLDLITYIPLDP